MSFFEAVIQKTRKLESLLESRYQASGKGLHEKATSVEHKLDSDLVGQIRFIASVRNKLMHVDGYSFDGSESDFLRKCDDAIGRLEKQPHYTPPPPRPEPKYTHTPPPKPRPTNSSSPTSESGTAPSSSSYGMPLGPTPPSASNKKSSTNFVADRVIDDFVSSIPGSILAIVPISIVLWLIVGTGACLKRFANVPFRPEDAGYGNSRLFKYIFAAYLYEGLIVVGVVFAIGMIVIFLRFLFALQRASSIRSGRSLSITTLVAVCCGLTVVAVAVVWGAPKVSNWFSGASSTDPTTSSSGDAPRPNAVIKADKVTKGRTGDEKVYEFIVPPNQWVETALKVETNQEVMVHHFASNEPVKVNLGGKTDTRLQKAGTILPMYTSKNCSSDKGVKAKVQYTCIYLTQPESIKLFAAKTIRVGVVVKNR